MSINLQTIKGTDIYDIGVFNSYFQQIQDSINPLLNSVGNLEDLIQKRYPYFTEQTNIDSNDVLDDGIYYNIVDNLGVVSSGKDILISTGKNKTEQTQILITTNQKGIKQRTKSTTSVSEWENLADRNIIINLDLVNIED